MPPPTKFGFRPQRVLILLVVACGLLILITSTTTIDYGARVFVTTHAKMVHKAITDTLFTSSDVVDFYHGRISKWKSSVSPRPELKCNGVYCHHVPELIAQPSPTSFSCPYFTLNGTNPLVVIGVFSIANGGLEQSAKRQLWRLSSKEGVPLHLQHLVDVRFVMGRSFNQTEEKLLDDEHALYGDLFRLNGLRNGENMDDGKTYEYFRAVYNQTKDRPSQRPVFVMKTDLDSFLVLPNILDDFYSFSKVCASDNALAYWGSAWRTWMDGGIPPYFRGIGYAISYPLLSWIASTPESLPLNSIKAIEDIRTGAWLWWLPEGTQLWLKDENWDAEDYDSKKIRYTTKVSIVHKLKTAPLWMEYSSRVRAAWRKATRDYVWIPQPWQVDLIR